MAKPYPREFRDDVVAVARKGQAPLAQIAKDFGISEGSLSNWMKQADVEDGKRAGLTDDERKQLREAAKRIRLIGGLPVAWRSSGDSMPWSIALRVRCVNTSLKRSMISRSSSISLPLTSQRTSLPRERASSRAIRAVGSRTWLSGNMRRTRAWSLSSWASRSCS